MGMYDDFEVYGKQADLFKCAAGHTVNGFQTKDFDCNMGLYLVDQGCLFFHARGERESAREVFRRDGNLIIQCQSIAVPYSHTGTVHVYTSCEECLPVLSGTRAEWRGYVTERHPWCEFSVYFENGMLMRVESVHCESREGIAREITAAGSDRVIPDTDWIAQRHFEQRADRKR